ncbi:MAG: hypothetical protein WDN46_24920 [Methylocella sp.]
MLGTERFTKRDIQWMINLNEASMLGADGKSWSLTLKMPTLV